MRKDISRFKKNHEAWHNDAEKMRFSAGVLWLAIKQGDGNEISKELGYDYEIDIGSYCRRNSDLLLGLSYELLFKSIIVLKNNEAELPKTHDLNKLSKLSGCEVNQEDKKLLELMSHYIIWAGKYPEPVKDEDNEEFNRIFNATVVRRFHSGNVYTAMYNGVLDWDKNTKLWNHINSYYNSLIKIKI